ncbi:Mu transposase C-terminal domain-containing protein [Pseudomonas sp. RA_105y_Pfl2_P56]|uniref:Mu transposase C-terminal domain-containing protein n=1 Tax=Pseudomonas sp. RA_105y_Pfl2_P56 TaxID=3088701 RepID=UPI0030D7793D
MKTLVPGQLVYRLTDAAVLVEIKGLTEAVVRIIESGATELVRVSDLSLSLPSARSVKSPLLLNKNEEWNRIVRRFEIIRPLLNSNGRVAADVKKVADASGVSVPTIYRWLKKYNDQELVSSLARAERTDKGGQRLGEKVEAVIQDKIQNFYLTKERPRVPDLCNEIGVACRAAGLPSPHLNTIYFRVKNIDKETLTRERFGYEKVRDDLIPHRGGFPGGDYPNAVVQIDHSPMDVIVVDEEHRLPIGRPYLTIAIDVATKMLTGFYLTLESPSAMSAGLCIAHAVLRKEHWLAKRDIFADWPIYGKMTKIHVDNAKEFQGNMLKRACDQHNIILEFRPKKQPNYGPHVERAFRTFMQEAHTIPGTTFSNVQSKLKYDSEGRACMTLEELELWFAVFVVYRYHHKTHAGINDIPPINLYNQFVHGTDTQLGVGLPAPVQDEEKFRLDFTPYLERTVQQNGVLINYINYYSPVLRKWIGIIDPVTKRSRKFIFAYDPRDISSVYFLDPDTHAYVQIPYLNSAHAAISLWELKAVVKKEKENPHAHINEDMIFKGVKIMRDMIDEAIERTRLAKQRRTSEKRSLRRKERMKSWTVVQQGRAPVNLVADEVIESDYSEENIKPFENIEVEKFSG